VTDDRPLYQRDPQAWRKHLAEGNSSQARKRVAADALIFDEAGRILLVDPGYKPGWDLPGGMAEANESPADCVRREVSEELGIDVNPDALLCIDGVPPHGPWDDMIAFIFNTGTLTGERVAGIRLLDGELNKFEFCDQDQAEIRLGNRMRRRMTAALVARRTNSVIYLHDGYQAAVTLPGNA
jgi:8-oxo-dGTP diphosphatase